MLLRLRHIILLFALLLGASLTHVQAAIYQGTCGAPGNEENVTWTFDTETGVLTISGTGAMQDWDLYQDKPWESHKTSITTVSVGNGVTNIGRCAFYNYTKITSLTLPESLEVIGDYAFYYCSSFKSVTVPSNVTDIRAYAFYSCKNLRSVIIPSSVKLIGMYAFNNCTYLFNIYLSWTSNIPKCPYEFASNNSTIYIPCGTRDLYEERGWTTYPIKEGDGSGTCGVGLEWKICDSVLTITSTGTGNGEIVGGAFHDSPKFKHVIIGEGVTGIGSGTFKNCENLVSVSNPSTLIWIGSEAFKNCKKLDTFNFPNNLRDINSDSFYECNSLPAIYIPASVTKIEQHAFLRCYSVTSIVVDSDNPKYDSRDNSNAIIETASNTLLYGCRNTVIPDDIEEINSCAFEYQHDLYSIHIPNTVQSFGVMVLKECENLTDIYVDWTENIPNDNKLTVWAESEDLDATITLHVPCGCKALYQALDNWNKFNIVEDHVKSGLCGAQGSNLTWMLDCDGVLTIKGSGDMADYLFTDLPWLSKKSSIKSVVIENGVTSIGWTAFADCVNLTSVKLPNSVTSMCGCVFRNCSTLTSVKLPSGLTCITPETFKNCVALTEVNISNNCDTILGNAFEGCTSLSSITLPDGLRYLGNYAFHNCTALTSITIPGGVPEVQYHAFEGCTALTSVTFEQGIEKIGPYAFKGCTSLPAVNIPTSVTVIYADAFANCTALTDIYVSWTEKAATAAKSMTNKTPQTDINLHVLCGTEELYQNEPWSKYTIVGDGTYEVSVDVNDDSMGSVTIEIIE